MDEEKTITEDQTPSSPLPPLRGHDLPEGFHATGYLTPTGTRWTFLEVVRGRTLFVLLVATGAFAALGLPVLVRDVTSPVALLGSLLNAVTEYATGDEYHFAFLVAPAIQVFLPVIIVLGIPCTFVIKAIYNAREKRTAPVPRVREIHEYDTRFTWNVLYAALLGSLVFVVLFLIIMYVLLLAITLLYRLGLLALDAEPSDTTMLFLSFVALALTEIPGYWLAGSGSANSLVVEWLAVGGYDAWLPERLCDPEGRALVARLLGAGAANTVGGAVLLARVLDLREYIGNASDVLGDLLDAFATIVTFGAFGLVVRAAEDAGAACAENAARGISFGDPAFEWPRPMPGELRRRSARTALLAGLLFLLVVLAQPFVMAA